MVSRSSVLIGTLLNATPVSYLLEGYSENALKKIRQVQLRATKPSMPTESCF